MRQNFLLQLIRFVKKYYANSVIKKNLFISVKSSTGNDVDCIYFLKGDTEHPIFRIHILQNGQIELLGSCGNYGSFEPLEIFGDKRGPIVNNDFKTKIRYYYQVFLEPEVVWNTTGTNTVTATQFNSGPVKMKSVAYGRLRMDCPQ